MVSQIHDHLPKLARAILASCLALLLIFESSGCRRKTAAAKEATITIYGFSVVKEGLETSILPAYEREWKKKTGQRLTFETSYAGSEIVANQIVMGGEADVAILAIERNADRLFRPDVTRNEWRKLPYGGIINKTPMVIVVRQGNPKRIRDLRIGVDQIGEEDGRPRQSEGFRSVAAHLEKREGDSGVGP